MKNNIPEEETFYTYPVAVLNTMPNESEESFACRLWQKLFDLYRGSGGDLSNMQNILIDYKNCHKWVNSGFLHQSVYFRFEMSDTSWKLVDDPDNCMWLAIQYENCYILSFKNGLVTICGVANTLRGDKPSPPF